MLPRRNLRNKIYILKLLSSFMVWQSTENLQHQNWKDYRYTIYWYVGDTKRYSYRYIDNVNNIVMDILRSAKRCPVVPDSCFRNVKIISFQIPGTHRFRMITGYNVINTYSSGKEFNENIQMQKKKRNYSYSTGEHCIVGVNVIIKVYMQAVKQF